MRLLTTLSHTSKRQRYEAGKVRQKKKGLKEGPYSREGQE